MYENDKGLIINWIRRIVVPQGRVCTISVRKSERADIVLEHCGDPACEALLPVRVECKCRADGGIVLLPLSHYRPDVHIRTNARVYLPSGCGKDEAFLVFMIRAAGSAEKK